MKFFDFYGSGDPVISFEVFPPKTEKGLALLQARLPKLLALQPSFMTVTYGAMGSSRQHTLEIASRIRNEYRAETAHHLTCVGSTREEIDQILGQIRRHHIENVVALRGDPPQGQTQFKALEGGYSHASQLVEHIHAFGGFGIAVAGYPEKHIEAPDLETDLKYLKRKVDAGADVIITQLFYDNSHFYRFRERCRAIGIRQPIVPGLMPILKVGQIKRITQMCGSRIPDELLRQLDQASSHPERVRQIGVTHTTNQALDLLEHGIPGIHFYVLNEYFHIAEIMSHIQPALLKQTAKEP